MPAITVIVPVYGVEKYIERCALSIFRQTLTGFEVIFVNDCSLDASDELLLNFIRNYDRQDIVVKHIYHECNRGISATRQTGMEAATGDFIFYLDSDDYLAENALEQLFLALQNKDADVAYSDYFEDRSDGQYYIDQAVDALQGEKVVQAMLRQQVSWTPWGKLMRKTLFNGIKWPNGINVGEDLVVITRVFSKARTVAHLKSALYYYNRQNAGSIISTMNPSACRQTKMAIDQLQEYFSKHQQILNALQSTKLFLRFLYLYSQDIKLINEIPSTYPETNGFISHYSKAPKSGRWMMRLLLTSSSYFPPVILRLEGALWMTVRQIKARKKRK